MKKKFSRIWGVALVVALLTSLMVAAVPASAVSQPIVTLYTPGVDDVISKSNANYIIAFKVAKALTANATYQPTITLTFPADTGIATPSATIAASPGWVGTNWWGSNTTSTNWTFNPTYRTISWTMQAGDVIGESAEVRINITGGITNPSAAGSYKLTVGTYIGATPIELPVESAPYTISVPYIPPLGGLVELYNPANVLMARDIGSAAIANILALAGTGYTVKIAPGTYSSALTVANPQVTLVATGAAAETIITGTIGITNQDKVTIQGLTLSGAITANNATTCNIMDCVVVPVSPTATATLLTVSNIADPFKPLTLSNTSIAVTGATPTGIDVTSAYVTVSGCTLTVDTGGTVAVVHSGSLTLMNSTVTGASGTGVSVLGGSATISMATLKTLTTALSVSGGASGAGATVTNSTIEGCGSGVLYGADAIMVSGNSTATLYSNTIKDSAAVNYALSVLGGTVTAWFNNITGNALNVNTAVGIDIRHNWWGAATGPAPGTVVGAGTYTTKSLPVSGASVSAAAAAFAPATGVDASTTVGVSVIGLHSNVAEALDSVAVAKYVDNPQIAAPAIAGVGSVLGYYDVFYSDAGADTLQIKFYGPISSYTKVYYGGALSGLWAEPSNWGVNTAGGYIYVTVTSGSSPSLVDLTGTPFALVEDKTLAPPTLQAPDLGADGVSIAPTFVWSAVPGAIRYEFALSEDSAFTILKWSANVPSNMYAAPEELKYDTTYYWKVRGVLDEPYQTGFPPVWVTPSTPWAPGIFTTEEEPVEAVTEVTVPAPKVDVTVEPAQITVEPSAPAIPTYLLWVIVGVGAVLVIALIVLIVRTRRVA